MADLSIKNGWIYAAGELAGKVDPSGTQYTASGFGNLLKTGWIETARDLADKAGMDVETLSTSCGWIETFKEINTEVDPGR